MKGLVSNAFVFVSVSEFGCHIYSEPVEMKEISVKLLKILQHTFRNTTYSKSTRLLHHAISISIASKMADVD